MDGDYFQIIVALAVLLIAALIGGRLAMLLRVPRVTGYLLAGLFVGPSFAELFELPRLVSNFALGELAIISDVALALILMNIGGQLRTENLRRWKHRIYLFSAGEAFTCGLLVGGSVFIVNQFILGSTVATFSLLQTSTL